MEPSENHEKPSDNHERPSANHETKDESDTNEASKDLSCNDCNKSFSTKWNLKVHERIHTVEKNNKKPKKEIRIHQQDKPKSNANFENFEQLDHQSKNPVNSKQQQKVISLLKEEIRIQQQDKPNSDANFEQQKEVPISGNENPFGCAMCYKSFALPKFLADHVEMYHSQKEPQNWADGSGGAGVAIPPPIFGRCRSKTFSLESPSITLSLSNLPAELQNKVDIANGFKDDDKKVDTHETDIDQKEDIYIFTEEDNVPKLIQSNVDMDIPFNLTLDQLEPNTGIKI